MNDKIAKTWEIFFLSLAFSLLAFLLTMASYGFFVKAYTVRYELQDSNSSNEVGVPCIIKLVENGQDQFIQLSKDISWDHAIQMCDSLNKQLKKYPTK